MAVDHEHLDDLPEPTTTVEDKTYTLWVVVVDTETQQAVDLYPAEIADMDNLWQARLAARLMAGVM